LKILLLKPSSLGDVVQALPVLRLLKLHFPDSHLFWWIESSLAPLLEADPDLAGLLRFERQRWARPTGWPDLFASLRDLRARQFDWVIDLQGLARSALFGWLANSGLFVGLDNPGEGGRDGARAFYDLRPPRCAPGTHAVDRYLAVLPLLGVPVHDRFQWLPERPPVAAAVRAKWNADGARWLVLLPGARWTTKRWPAEHFAELVRGVASDFADLRFVILGSRAEAALAQPIAAACPERVLDLTGQTSLPEMVEWLRLSQLVVTNDTGPMHVAAALGKPVVALFGPTNPASTGPYRQVRSVLQNRTLPCVPCFKGQCSYAAPLECLRSLTPTMVAARVRQALSRSNSTEAADDLSRR
jgi:lipopolysaccharide heptosyltransferase I